MPAGESFTRSTLSLLVCQHTSPNERCTTLCQLKIGVTIPQVPILHFLLIHTGQAVHHFFFLLAEPFADVEFALFFVFGVVVVFASSVFPVTVPVPCLLVLLTFSSRT